MVARGRHGAAELAFHERIEPAGRLVQDEKVGPRRERGDDPDLLPVTLRVGPHLLRRIQLEVLDQLVAVRGVDVALHAAQQMQGLGSGERRPQRHLARDVREARVRGDRVAVRVETEDLRAPVGRSQQTEEQADRHGLPGTVRSEVTQRFADRDVEVERVQRLDVAEAFRQTFRANGCCHVTILHRRPTTTRLAPITPSGWWR